MQLDHSQLERYSKYQLILLVDLSVVTWIIFFLAPDLLSLNIQLLILLFTVTLIGIPHGYFDFLVAKYLFSSAPSWLLKFIIAYLALSLVYLLIWLITPVVGLVTFLLMAMYHFAHEETENIESNNSLLALSVGSVPIIAPIIYHANDVFSLFSILLNEKLSAILLPDLYKYIYVILVLFIIFSYGRKLLLLYLLLFINFIYLPPIASFILYFCFHHSIRHYLYALNDQRLFDKKISLTKYVIFFLVLTVAFTIFMLTTISSITSLSLDEMIIKYIFITLACLTLPHLLLNIIYEKKSNKLH